MDINAHVGGPIVKDKLWFYVGGQFYRTKNRPTGFPEDVDYKQPRFFAKLTSQLTPSLNMNLCLPDGPSTRARTAAPGPRCSPEATVTQDSPDWLVSFSLTKILSPKTFFDLKTNYFEGSYYLDPEVRATTPTPTSTSTTNMLLGRSVLGQLRLLLLRRPGPVRDQRQPDPLRRGLPRRLPRVQVRRRVRAVHGPEPLRLHGHGRRRWATTSSTSITSATATAGTTWPTSTRATTTTPATPGSRLRPGQLADREAAEHQPRPPLQPELGRRQGHVAAPSSRPTGWPPAWASPSTSWATRRPSSRPTTASSPRPCSPPTTTA